MRKVIIICLLLSGCATARNLPHSISYIYVNMPDTQEWKLIREEDKKWMEGVIKNCVWVKSGDVKTSKYVFEITSNNEMYFAQLLDGYLYMAGGDVIYKCKLDSNGIERVKSFYAS